MQNTDNNNNNTKASITRNFLIKCGKCGLQLQQALRTYNDDMAFLSRAPKAPSPFPRALAMQMHSIDSVGKRPSSAFWHSVIDEELEKAGGAAQEDDDLDAHRFNIVMEKIWSLTESGDQLRQTSAAWPQSTTTISRTLLLANLFRLRSLTSMLLSTVQSIRSTRRTRG